MISQNRKTNQRGSFMMEFAFVAPALVLMAAGAFEVGFSLVRSIQARTVCRNANVLLVRGIDLSLGQNQQLLMRATVGLAMTQTGTWSPDPNGKGVIILSKIYRVGPLECNQGITNWDGTPASCPNYGNYVIAERLNIGNASRWTSLTGTPADTPQTNGLLTDFQIASHTSNASSAFPALLPLNLDQFTYVSELYLDISAYNFFSIVQTPVVYMRNMS
jgi:Flp pilus assembly protein TadG